MSDTKVYYLQYGVPDAKPRLFVDERMHPLARHVDSVEAECWKDARKAMSDAADMFVPPAE